MAGALPIALRGPASGKGLTLSTDALRILAEPIPEHPRTPYADWCKTHWPQMSWHWPHLQAVFQHIERVWDGGIKRLLITMPPQHGKTTGVTHRVPPYWMAHRPGTRVALASYSQNYSNHLSSQAKRVASVAVKLGTKDAANEWDCANGSSMYAVGVGGGITGRSVDLMIIDDPVKSREEADSQAFRERCWDWYIDDISTRLQENAPVILIMTRWHMDDLAGRILASEERGKWHVLRLPAIAEEGDQIGRTVGEPLCVDRFSLETLEDRRKLSPETFEALYQGNPVPRGGSFFKRDWFTIADRPPEKAKRLRYWDLAATKSETACWTAGVLMSYDKEFYYIEHVDRFREGPAERNELIRKTAELDQKRQGYTKTWFEEQPGGAGVETSQAMIRKMSGLRVQSDRVSGSKETRAEPLADAARGGLIRLVRGAWNEAFINELATFPRGATKDQVDSASGAYNRLQDGELVVSAK
jgi:predicted phage terminase large subunit-like protein